MDAALLVAADVLFLLEQPFKFRRENCIIVRQMDVVVLDAWRQLVSDVGIAGSQCRLLDVDSTLLVVADVLCLLGRRHCPW